MSRKFKKNIHYNKSHYNIYKKNSKNFFQFKRKNLKSLEKNSKPILRTKRELEILENQLNNVNKNRFTFNFDDELFSLFDLV